VALFEVLIARFDYITMKSCCAVESHITYNVYEKCIFRRFVCFHCAGSDILLPSFDTEQVGW
jgi:hypothetical protein